MKHHDPSIQRPSARRFALVMVGVVCFGFMVVGILYAILTGATRLLGNIPAPAPLPIEEPVRITSSTIEVPRMLDGVSVLPGMEALRPWAFMIDNQPDARPALGLEHASVVIEAPVEGGITRFLAIFDSSVSSTSIGAVRSARPYFVEWAESWKAVFAHVGGSPEALDKLTRIPSTTLLDLNEMTRGEAAFRRDPTRVSPHQVLTSAERFRTFLAEDATRMTGRFSSWRYRAPLTVSSTVDVASVRIPYGGSYSVRWVFDASMEQYRRSQGGKALSVEPLFASNVVVLKTEAQILDEKGRLKLKTVGSGDLVLYRDGKKYLGRWRRAAGEVMRFTTTDGSDLELAPGTTWIEVTTSDLTFAGLES